MGEATKGANAPLRNNYKAGVWVGGGPDPAPLPGGRQNVLELRKSPGPPTPLSECQGRAVSAQPLTGAPGIQAEPRWMRVGLPFYSRPSVPWLSAISMDTRNRQISLFPNFLGLGANKSSLRLLLEQKELALPGNPLCASPSKALYPNHPA